MDLDPELREGGEQYQFLRGLLADGTPDPKRLAKLGRSEWTRTPCSMVGEEVDGLARACAIGSEGASLVGVELRLLGALEPRLGDGLCLMLKGQPSQIDALQAITDLYPGIEHWLLSSGRPVPAAMCREQPLLGDSLLRHGDVLELVLAIFGG